MSNQDKRSVFTDAHEKLLEMTGLKLNRNALVEAKIDRNAFVVKKIMPPDKRMTVGELRDMIEGVPGEYPIDFGCQCDSFDKWEAQIELHNEFADPSLKPFLTFYLIRGKNATEI